MILRHLNYFLFLTVCMSYCSILFVLTFCYIYITEYIYIYIYFLKKTKLYFIGSVFESSLTPVDETITFDLENITERIVGNTTLFIWLSLWGICLPCTYDTLKTIFIVCLLWTNTLSTQKGSGYSYGGLFFIASALSFIHPKAKKLDCVSLCLGIKNKTLLRR